MFVVCRMCVIEAGRGGGLACAVMFMAVLMEEPKSSSVAKMSSNGPQNLAKYSAKEETRNLHWGLEAANRCSCECLFTSA